MVNFDPDPADVALSSVPGQEAFDPRRHRFTDEELKPQPMIKKARKMLVPVEQKVLQLPQFFASKCRLSLMVLMCDDHRGIHIQLPSSYVTDDTGVKTIGKSETCLQLWY